MIAPGNHWISDSLRGAPPPGEAMGAAAPETLFDKLNRNLGSGFLSEYAKSTETMAKGIGNWAV